MAEGESSMGDLPTGMTELRQRLQELEHAEKRRRIAEECMLQWEMRFRALTQSPLYGIVCLDPCMRVAFWNQGAERIFGYTEQEAQGMQVRALLPDLPELLRRLHDESLIQEGRILSLGRPFECKGVRKTGDLVPVEFCISSWKDRSGVSYSVVIRDISFRKRAIEALQCRAEEARKRAEELETLIQSVAHDLKSPVVTVRGLAQLLVRRSRGSLTDHDCEQALLQIATSARSMEALLNALLEGLSAPHAKLQWAPVHLRTTIEEVLDQHKQELQEKGIRVMIDVQERLPDVYGDKHRIGRIIDNLVANAIRHMGERTRPFIQIRCVAKTGFIVVSVSDNGRGIPPEQQSKIFDRFVRAPDPQEGTAGSGLGLFIAKKFVESHQGRIWVESKLGRGTTFSFTLPKFTSGELTDYQI